MSLVVSSDAYAQKTLYLNPGVWNADGAKFAIYYYKSSTDNGWSDYMTSASGGYYQGTVPEGYSQVIFCRMNPNGSKDWNGKWNQTEDLTIPTDGKNQYNISGWGPDGGKSPGAWSTYDDSGDNPGGGDTPGSGAAGYGFYAMGWINGADAGETAYDKYDNQYKFVDGKLTINCTKGSYIGIKDDDGNFYYSKTNTTIADMTVTFDWADGSFSNCQKWAIPEGVNYIIMREVNFKGQIKLERVDQATYDAYHLDMGGGGEGGDDDYKPADYETAVPSQCTDVMLQAFYWNSHGDTDADRTYGTSTWNALKTHATEIGSYFDIVWLPASCRSKDKMGYLPMQYPNQNNYMGTEGELQALMKVLHAGGRTKVIADVVINHAGDQNWVNFLPQDFGEYGRFEPDGSYICSTDEMNDPANKKEAGECFGTATGSPDDGHCLNCMPSFVLTLNPTDIIASRL